MNKRNSFKVFFDGKGKKFVIIYKIFGVYTNAIPLEDVDYNKHRPLQHRKRKPLQSKQKLENVRKKKISESRKKLVPQLLEQKRENDGNSLSARDEEFLIDYLKSIFPDREKSEEHNPNFKATSTPFSSQIELDVSRDVILNQDDLDFEINKIHDSINGNGTRQRQDTKPIRKNPDIYHKHRDTRISTEVIEMPGKRLQEKEISKKGKGRRGVGRNERLVKCRSQNPNVNHDTCMTKPNTFIIPKDRNQLNKTKATKQNSKPPINAKKELSYGDIMKMCQKGRDPIDLLF